VSAQYEREPETGDGLRLHLNENTAGCSPRVLAALTSLSRADVALYPDAAYTRMTRAATTFFGVDESRLLLTNGLDEGLMAASMACLLRGARGAGNGDAPEAIREAIPEAIIVEPAFGMYADCVEATGGRAVRVSSDASLAFPLDAVLARITESTRLIFLTSPGNPTGLPIPRPALRALARRVPADALLFLDEAYADFVDASSPDRPFLDELPQWPNIVVGRTFAKAYGLAGIRIGAVIGAADAIARLRRAVPPYSVNVAAAVALVAALEDQAYVQEYREQVRASRELVYAACDRLGLTYWRSQANFVLVRVGPEVSSVVRRLAARGVFVRDRSTQPGCAGCLRITTGIVDHTRQGLAALEEVLCERP